MKITLNNITDFFLVILVIGSTIQAVNDLKILNDAIRIQSAIAKMKGK